MIITVIGAGMMGAAMAFPAVKNGHIVRLVGTHLDEAIVASVQKSGYHPTLKQQLPAGVTATPFAQLDDALAGADLVLCAVSSFGVPWFCQQVLPRLPKGLPMLSITKGLEQDTLRSFPEVFARVDASRPYVAVGGPCTSYELADGHQTSVAFCGPLPLAVQLATWFETDTYHPVATDDVQGVEVAVALKNAYALGVTLAVGQAELRNDTYDYNSQAALFGQAAREMHTLIALLGGRPDAIAWGVGDLFVTIFGGRTRLLGTLLGKGLTIDEALAELSGVTLESVAIARRVGAYAEQKGIRGLPLLSHVYALLSGKTGDIPWASFQR